MNSLTTDDIRTWLLASDDDSQSGEDAPLTRAETLDLYLDDMTSPVDEPGGLASLAYETLKAGLFDGILRGTKAALWLIADAGGDIDGVIVTAELPDGRRGATELTRLRDFDDDDLGGVELAVYALNVVAACIREAVTAVTGKSAEQQPSPGHG